jgi:hypothetical protein
MTATHRRGALPTRSASLTVDRRSLDDSERDLVQPSTGRQLGEFAERVSEAPCTGAA